jgi:hypothetical protein
LAEDTGDFSELAHIPPILHPVFKSEISLHLTPLTLRVSLRQSYYILLPASQGVLIPVETSGQMICNSPSPRPLPRAQERGCRRDLLVPMNSISAQILGKRVRTGLSNHERTSDTASSPWGRGSG